MSYCQEANDYLNQYVPLFRAMCAWLERCDDSGVLMRAPLAPNINDKGIAFGGSMAALAALSGWALTWSLLREHGERPEILIGECNLKFLRPVSGEIVIECARPDAAVSTAFLTQYRARDKARWTVTALAQEDGLTAMTFTGQYAALQPRSAA